MLSDESVVTIEFADGKARVTIPPGMRFDGAGVRFWCINCDRIFESPLGVVFHLEMEHDNRTEARHAV